MSTVIRAELAESNPYYISKHRFYELKHHCLQYYEWQHTIAKLRARSLVGGSGMSRRTSTQVSDRTADLGALCAELSHSMDQIESCSKSAGGDIAKWIFMAVTEGVSYPVLEARGIPCGKEYFYNRYRKFYWMMDQVR